VRYFKNLVGAQTDVFVRTRFTWLAYILLGYYAYLQASVGPLMPFLRSELHMSYTLEGLHFSAFAFGAVLVGLSGNRVTRLCGRRRVFWGGAGVMAAGAVALVISHHPILTLLSLVIMGYAGNLLLMTIQSTLSDQHQEQRSIALIEANVVASIGASLAPLCVGGLQSVALGWRSALMLMVLILLLIFPVSRNISIPGGHYPARKPSSAPHALAFPLSFWAYWTVVLLGVAIEWCIVYWGADFLAQESRLSKSVAASLVSLFFLAEIVGRFIGSRLARSIRSTRLILLAVLLAVTGFPLFWLAPFAPLRLIGLCITGMGIANLWPLSIALTLGTVPEQTDAASARIALGAGMAILIAPFVLGWLADQVGIRGAYGIVALLLLLISGTIVVANRLAKSVVFDATK
jgi:MFS family permease